MKNLIITYSGHLTLFLLSLSLFLPYQKKSIGVDNINIDLIDEAEKIGKEHNKFLTEVFLNLEGNVADKHHFYISNTKIELLNKEDILNHFENKSTSDNYQYALSNLMDNNSKAILTKLWNLSNEAGKLEESYFSIASKLDSLNNEILSLQSHHDKRVLLITKEVLKQSAFSGYQKS